VGDCDVGRLSTDAHNWVQAVLGGIMTHIEKIREIVASKGTLYEKLEAWLEFKESCVLGNIPYELMWLRAILESDNGIVPVIENIGFRSST
jgi:hypothetical protein